MPRRLVLAVTVLVCALAGAQSAAAAPTDLFFSEYIEGTSNNKALEIYTANNTLSLHDALLIYVPKAPAFLSAILAVIPLQLLAYRIARLRGLNVDQPRNLAKTVTVE